VSTPLGEWDDVEGPAPATSTQTTHTPAQAPSAARDKDAAQPAPLYFGSVDEFVREYLRHVYKRRIDGRRRVWDAQWWRYDEAVIRLEALWRAWEHLRLDPATGMSVWWRDHADHHLPILLDPEGPFAAADPEANTTRPGQPLPYEAPPEGLFPDVRTRGE
jgi:hypothetical protein